MKIKAIATIAQKEKAVKLCNTEDTQWVMLKGAAYPLYGLPELNPETLPVVMDIPEHKSDKMLISWADKPDELCFDDVCDGERELPPPQLVSIGYGGQVMYPEITSKGLVFYDPEYLKPLDGEFALYERVTKSGQIYLAAKTGFMLKAIIMPIAVNTTDMAARLSSLLYALQTESGVIRTTENIAIDLGTGEVVEGSDDNGR